MLNRMPSRKPPKTVPKLALVGAREAMRILDKDRGTVIRWGREGRITIAYQMQGNGAFLYDRASVEALAKELAVNGNR